MAISTNQKHTIYRNLYENTGPGKVYCHHYGDPMLTQCWPIFFDAGSTINQHCVFGYVDPTAEMVARISPVSAVYIILAELWSHTVPSSLWWPNAGSMLAHCFRRGPTFNQHWGLVYYWHRRWWLNIKPTSAVDTISTELWSHTAYSTITAHSLHPDSRLSCFHT